jgi:uroporphyrinogen decarboxylase
MPENRIMLDALKGEAVFPPPLWMMRQAGRYLPEYRETRRRAGSFLDLCYDPDLAVEVTLQPIERFGFDASILFSDILVVPHALGRDVRFEEGRGPLLTPISATEIAALDGETFHVNLEPVYETVRRLRTRLPDETTLIGFCGAPWTVATYMIAGHGTPDQRPAREAAYRNEAWFAELIALVTEASVDYLCAQIEAGAQAVQIFDTWAGVLSDREFDALCVAPLRRIVEAVGARHRGVPIIGFPRGAGMRYARFARASGVDCVGLDWTVPLKWAQSELQNHVSVQGNLDPVVLAAGGPALDRAVDDILEALDRDRHVFNLGHGILPDTPPAHVEQVLKRVRDAG